MVPIKTPMLAATVAGRICVSQRGGSDHVSRRQEVVTPMTHVNRSINDAAVVASRAGIFMSKSRGRGDGVKEAMQLITFLGEGYRLLCMSQCKEAIHAFAR